MTSCKLDVSENMQKIQLSDHEMLSTNRVLLFILNKNIIIHQEQDIIILYFYYNI